MNNTKYLHEQDAHIERKENVFHDPIAELQDEEGTRIFEFPPEWTDEAIMLALRFANHAYFKGVDAGKDIKVREIKACLSITV